MELNDVVSATEPRHHDSSLQQLQRFSCEGVARYAPHMKGKRLFRKPEELVSLDKFDPFVYDSDYAVLG
jgi:hypothetical protein